MNANEIFNMQAAGCCPDAPDFVEELRECAWNVALENPGIDRDGWIDRLLRQYPSEVVDAFGVDADEVSRRLDDLWESEFAKPVIAQQ